MKSWFTGKDPDAGRDLGQEEKGTAENEMAGWHHRLDGHEFEWTPWVGDGQGGLACCDSWGCKELDTTERLNWTELNWTDVHCSIIYNRQDMEANGVPINRWMVKEEACIYVYTYIKYHSAIKMTAFTTTWMDLESIRLSKISHKDRYLMTWLTCRM